MKEKESSQMHIQHTISYYLIACYHSLNFPYDKQLS